MIGRTKKGKLAVGQKFSPIFFVCTLLPPTAVPGVNLRLILVKITCTVGWRLRDSTVTGHGIGGKYIPIMAHLAKARRWSKR